MGDGRRSRGRWCWWNGARNSRTCDGAGGCGEIAIGQGENETERLFHGAVAGVGTELLTRDGPAISGVAQSLDESTCCGCRELERAFQLALVVARTPMKVGHEER